MSAKDYEYQQSSRPRLDSGVRLSVRAACRHCGADTPAGEEFCCSGCEGVFALLQSEGLSRYYDLRGKDGIAAQEPHARDHKWLEVLEAGRQVSLDVQGIHCAACVWLFEQLFKRHRGAIAIVVNPTLGKLDLTTEPPFSLRAFVEDVERFGYALGPSLKEDRAPSSDLTLRIGVCVAIAMNAMIFAVAIYCGLREGPIYRLFEAINFAFGTLSVLVGGTVFFRSAWQAIKHRVLHLDAPIALGIVLAYAGSAWAYFARGGGTYFDTLSVFIALMLVGRLLQERVVEKNRRMLLANDGVDGLLTRRLESGVVKVVRCSEIAPGDQLLVAPGDLVVVPGRIEDASATCSLAEPCEDVLNAKFAFSLDWINGESAPRAYARGDEVPAGAFNAGAGAIVIHASVPFEDSPVVGLLRATRERSDAARTTAWWQAFARIYVLAVFALAFTGFLGWLLATHDVERALVVTAGVLIVTCPCAFGIATPLGYELALAGLRRAGLFVRAAGFLDRARGITKVVFDKTGTLTTGALEMEDPSALDVLTPAERTTLYNLVARSGHPKSQAIARGLEKRGALFVHGLDVVEEPGKGLVHRNCAVRASEGDVAFFVDGAPRATFRLRERLRPDARREVESLERAGYEVWILSGDDPKNVEALADRTSVPRARALGGQSPEAKLAFVREHDKGDTLVVGDGLNDSLAVEGATCSGTPAIDRPFLPARSDFYFTTPGLRPIGLALRAARALEKVTHRNLAVALAYNVVAVGLAYAGLLSPLVCAVIMPVSSITVIACTSLSLSPRSALWRS